MSSENHDTPVTVQVADAPLEQSHTASDTYKAHTGSEAHFGHLTGDAHQAQSGMVAAQALGGFPKVGSAISDPNAIAPAQVIADNSKPPTEQAKG